jgi:hypothetical protein
VPQVLGRVSISVDNDYALTVMLVTSQKRMNGCRPPFAFLRGFLLPAHLLNSRRESFESGVGVLQISSSDSQLVAFLWDGSLGFGDGLRVIFDLLDELLLPLLQISFSLSHFLQRQLPMLLGDRDMAKALPCLEQGLNKRLVG